MIGIIWLAGSAGIAQSGAPGQTISAKFGATRDPVRPMQALAQAPCCRTRCGRARSPIFFTAPRRGTRRSCLPWSRRRCPPSRWRRDQLRRHACGELAVNRRGAAFLGTLRRGSAPPSVTPDRADDAGRTDGIQLRAVLRVWRRGVCGRRSGLETAPLESLALLSWVGNLRRTGALVSRNSGCLTAASIVRGRKFHRLELAEFLSEGAIALSQPLRPRV